MQITLNGEHFDATDGSSIAGLLTQLGISAERVAVEVNEDIVPRIKYGEHLLESGDIVEIVHFVGGG